MKCAQAGVGTEAAERGRCKSQEKSGSCGGRVGARHRRAPRSLRLIPSLARGCTAAPRRTADSGVCRQTSISALPVRGQELSQPERPTAITGKAAPFQNLDENDVLSAK